MYTHIADLPYKEYMHQIKGKIAGLLIGMIFFITLLNGCRKEVELSFNHQPKLCFNCILNPDSVIKADLSLSQAIGVAENFVPVTGAKIELYENNQFYGVLNDNGYGNYSNNYHPQYGAEYKIRIQKDDYPTSEATTKVPDKTKIEYTTILMDTTEQLYKKTVKIYDPKGKNQYWFYAYSIYGNQKYSGATSNMYESFFDDFNKKQETESKYGFIYLYMVRFSDELCDGKVMQVNYWPRTLSTMYTNFDKYMEVDTHYDKYLKTSVQALMLKNEQIPMSEPLQIYSNVSNGYGIFGSCVMFTIIEYPIK